MKITRLSFKNINSLAGSWCINFEKGGYYETGLFAILGNTASGKTSILDAICLALYGESPRGLGPAECASWNTEDSFAEVTYQAKGQVYVSKYTISANTRGASKGKYIGKRADFVLTQPDKGSTLATGVRQVSAKNSELIGLDAMQFQRVVLLAQGCFDKFLMADEKNRADILAKITSMALYDRIGEKVEKRYSREKDALSRQEALCENAKLLSEDDVTQLQERLAAKETERTEAKNRREEITGLLICCDNIRHAQEAVQKWSGEAEKLAADQADFRLQEPVLALVDACEPIQKGAWKDFASLAQEKTRTQATLTDCENAIQVLEKDSSERECAANAAGTAFDAAVKAQADAAPVIETVKSLDVTIHKDEQLMKELLREETRRRCQLKDSEKTLAELKSTLERTAADAVAASEYVRNHGEDAVLAVKNAAWQAQFHAIQGAATRAKDDRDRAVSAKQAEYAAEEKRKKAQDAVEKAMDALKDCDAALTNMENDRTQLLAGRTREDMTARIEALYYADSADVLARLRGELQEGAACPLCGAVHHPYAEKYPEDGKAKEERDELKVCLAKLDTLEKRLADAQLKKQTVAGEVSHAKDKQAMLLAAWKEKQTAAEQAEKDAANAENALDTCTGALRAELDSCGFAGWQLTMPLPAAIQTRLKDYADAAGKVQAFAEKRSALERDIAAQAATVDSQKSELDKQADANASLSDTLKNNQDERRRLFGGKSAADEAKRLSDAVEQARQTRDKSNNDRTECQARLNAKRKDATDLKAALDELQPKLDAAQEQFVSACDSAKITQEEFNRFLDMTTTQIQQLRDRRQALATRQQELEKHRRLADEALADAKAKLTVPDQEQDWRLEQTELDKKLADIAEETGKVKAILDEDGKKRQEYEKNLTELKRQKEIADKWWKLYALIGKSNNFQRIAQQLTLEELLGLANRHIRNLKMRYDLSTDTSSEHPLNIMVCDHFQGGTLRDVRSLSGGERFEVSLALALGLADMVSSTGTFQVDCLFIDEGFGNLSRGELENALNLLQRLNHGVNEKMVGIITHVDNIEEYLRQTIRVASLGNGVSTMDGNGVTRREPPRFLTQTTDEQTEDNNGKKTRRTRKQPQNTDAAEE